MDGQHVPVVRAWRPHLTPDARRGHTYARCGNCFGVKAHDRGAGPSCFYNTCLQGGEIVGYAAGSESNTESLGSRTGNFPRIRRTVLDQSPARCLREALLLAIYGYKLVFEGNTWPRSVDYGQGQMF